MIVQIPFKREGPRRRPRGAETPAARFGRRLRHFARMCEWYASHRRAQCRDCPDGTRCMAIAGGVHLLNLCYRLWNPALWSWMMH